MFETQKMSPHLLTREVTFFAFILINHQIFDELDKDSRTTGRLSSATLNSGE